VAGLVLLLMSMGPELRVAGHDTGIPLPFALISHVPIIDLVSVTRFAMVTATVVGVLLALAVDRAGALPDRRRVAFWAGLTVALVPLFPKPLPVVVADPLPAFIAQQMYRDYVPADRTLVSVPLPEVTWGREGMRWVTLSLFDYRSPRGYFMGPANPPADDTGSWNAPPRRTSTLLTEVVRYGRAVPVTAADRRAATDDLIFWRAAVVVLVPGDPNADVLERTVTDLLGEPPTEVGGVRLWDVRDLPVPPVE
jgi:hypothetical protein